MAAADGGGITRSAVLAGRIGVRVAHAANVSAPKRPRAQRAQLTEIVNSEPSTLIFVTA
jgi:hypothetical protein